MLFCRFSRKDGTGEHTQLIVPRKLRDEIRHQMHNSLLSGHLGKGKTMEWVIQHFYWFGVREDCDLWVEKCNICASVKKPPQKPQAPLGQMPVGVPMDRLATDILGPLPLTPRGNRYILLVTDYFTKWVEIFAVPDQTAATCAEVILNEVIAQFGCPLSLHSDQGKNYESKVFAELCQLLEIQKTRTSPGNPRCNGQADHFNRTLLKMIKAYLKGGQRKWDKHLGCLAAAYRGNRHSSTGLLPNLMMLGRETRMPVEVMCGWHTQEASETYGDYVYKLKERLQHAHNVARNHLHDSAKRQKQIYSARVKANQYEVRDLVWMGTDIGQLDVTPKLRVPYEGPYMIWKWLGLLNYEVHMFCGNPKIVHI